MLLQVHWKQKRKASLAWYLEVGLMPGQTSFLKGAAWNFCKHETL